MFLSLKLCNKCNIMKITRILYLSILVFHLMSEGCAVQLSKTEKSSKIKTSKSKFNAPFPKSKDTFPQNKILITKETSVFKKKDNFKFGEKSRNEHNFGLFDGLANEKSDQSLDIMSDTPLIPQIKTFIANQQKNLSQIKYEIDGIAKSSNIDFKSKSFIEKLDHNSDDLGLINEFEDQKSFHKTNDLLTENVADIHQTTSINKDMITETTFVESHQNSNEKRDKSQKLINVKNKLGHQSPSMAMSSDDNRDALLTTEYVDKNSNDPNESNSAHDFYENKVKRPRFKRNVEDSENNNDQDHVTTSSNSGAINEEVNNSEPKLVKNSVKINIKLNKSLNKSKVNPKEEPPIESTETDFETNEQNSKSFDDKSETKTSDSIHTNTESSENQSNESDFSSETQSLTESVSQELKTFSESLISETSLQQHSDSTQTTDNPITETIILSGEQNSLELKSTETPIFSPEKHKLDLNNENTTELEVSLHHHHDKNSKKHKQAKFKSNTPNPRHARKKSTAKLKEKLKHDKKGIDPGNINKNFTALNHKVVVMRKRQRKVLKASIINATDAQQLGGTTSRSIVKKTPKKLSLNDGNHSKSIPRYSDEDSDLHSDFNDNNKPLNTKFNKSIGRIKARRLKLDNIRNSEKEDIFNTTEEIDKNSESTTDLSVNQTNRESFSSSSTENQFEDGSDFTEHLFSTTNSTIENPKESQVFNDSNKSLPFNVTQEKVEKDPGINQQLKHSTRDMISTYRKKPKKPTNKLNQNYISNNTKGSVKFVPKFNVSSEYTPKGDKDENQSSTPSLITETNLEENNNYISDTNNSINNNLNKLNLNSEKSDDLDRKLNASKEKQKEENRENQELSSTPSSSIESDLAEKINDLNKKNDSIVKKNNSITLQSSPKDSLHINSVIGQSINDKSDTIINNKNKNTFPYPKSTAGPQRNTEHESNLSVPENQINENFEIHPKLNENLYRNGFAIRMYETVKLFLEKAKSDVEKDDHNFERIKNIYKERDAKEIRDNFYSILSSPQLKRAVELSELPSAADEYRVDDDLVDSLVQQLSQFNKLEKINPILTSTQIPGYLIGKGIENNVQNKSQIKANETEINTNVNKVNINKEKDLFSEITTTQRPWLSPLTTEAIEAKPPNNEPEANKQLMKENSPGNRLTQNNILFRAVSTTESIETVNSLETTETTEGTPTLITIIPVTTQSSFHINQSFEKLSEKLELILYKIRNQEKDLAIKPQDVSILPRTKFKQNMNFPKLPGFSQSDETTLKTTPSLHLILVPNISRSDHGVFENVESSSEIHIVRENQEFARNDFDNPLLITTEKSIYSNISPFDDKEKQTATYSSRETSSSIAVEYENEENDFIAQQGQPQVEASSVSAIQNNLNFDQASKTIITLEYEGTDLPSLQDMRNKFQYPLNKFTPDIGSENVTNLLNEKQIKSLMETPSANQLGAHNQAISESDEVSTLEEESEASEPPETPIDAMRVPEMLIPLENDSVNQFVPVEYEDVQEDFIAKPEQSQVVSSSVGDFQNKTIDFSYFNNQQLINDSAHIFNSLMTDNPNNEGQINQGQFEFSDHEFNEKHISTENSFLTTKIDEMNELNLFNLDQPEEVTNNNEYWSQIITSRPVLLVNPVNVDIPDNFNLGHSRNKINTHRKHRNFDRASKTIITPPSLKTTESPGIMHGFRPRFQDLSKESWNNFTQDVGSEEYSILLNKRHQSRQMGLRETPSTTQLRAPNQASKSDEVLTPEEESEGPEPPEPPVDVMRSPEMLIPLNNNNVNQNKASDSEIGITTEESSSNIMKSKILKSILSQLDKQLNPKLLDKKVGNNSKKKPIIKLRVYDFEIHDFDD